MPEGLHDHYSLSWSRQPFKEPCLWADSHLSIDAIAFFHFHKPQINSYRGTDLSPKSLNPHCALCSPSARCTNSNSAKSDGHLVSYH